MWIREMDWQTNRLSTRLTFSAARTEELFTLLADIDAVNTAVRLTGKLAPQIIIRLTQSVIITSTGASNRIEGNRLSDDEVEALYRNLHIRKFRTRDEQEVAGYAEVMETVVQSWADLRVTENHIKQLHRDLLRYSAKDERHRGEYKRVENKVEMINEAGESIGTLFDTTPAYLTPKEMQELVEWTRDALASRRYHPLLIVGNFIVEFLQIHPFQDGRSKTDRKRTAHLNRPPELAGWCLPVAGRRPIRFARQPL